MSGTNIYIISWFNNEFKLILITSVNWPKRKWNSSKLNDTDSKPAHDRKDKFPESGSFLQLHRKHIYKGAVLQESIHKSLAWNGSHLPVVTFRKRMCPWSSTDANISHIFEPHLKDIAIQNEPTHKEMEILPAEETQFNNLSYGSGSTVFKQCLLAMTISCHHNQTRKCWKFVHWVLGVRMWC